MASKKKSGNEHKFPLVALFTLVYAVLAGACVFALAYGFDRFATERTIEYGESNNINLANRFATNIWPRFGKFVQETTGGDNESVRANHEISELRAQTSTLARNTPVLKLKIYNRNGFTVFSSQESQIGESKRGNPGFTRAANTGVAASKTSLRGEFSAFSGVVSNVSLVETYVPVRGERGNIEGVFELYTNISDLAARNRQAKVRLIGFASAAALLIYLALLLVVWPAARRIRHGTPEHGALTIEQKMMYSIRQEMLHMREDLKNLSARLQPHVTHREAS